MITTSGTPKQNEPLPSFADRLTENKNKTTKRTNRREGAEIRRGNHPPFNG